VVLRPSHPVRYVFFLLSARSCSDRNSRLERKFGMTGYEMRERQPVASSESCSLLGAERLPPKARKEV
jgi:hypothetical protein